MKALKEKRISLRSLWRRGLVILSLFALLFAACSDSTTEDSTSNNGDGGGGNVSKGKEINRIEITKLPRPQYLGQPVDLEGIEALVYYTGDPKPVQVTDKSKFSASPRIVWGYYVLLNETTGKDAFVGMDKVLITYYDGQGNSAANIWQFADNRPTATGENKSERTDWVVGIVREDTRLAHKDWVTGDGNSGLDGLYDNGLNITGVPNMTKKAYFVDDEWKDLNFSGLKLEALYQDGATKGISTDDINWRIVPDYNRDKNAEGAHPGWLYITVGALDLENINYDIFSGAFGTPANGSGTGPGSVTSGYKPIPGFDGFPDWVNTGGITKRVALDAVYTVAGFDVVLEKDIEDYFFFQPNTPKAWKDRLVDANAKLEVRYDGTNATKSLSVKELADQELIWWNSNPVEVSVIEHDFAVLQLKYPFTKANPEPHILVYYRGGLTPVPIDVYTVLQEVKAESKAGGDLEYPGTRPLKGRDNDAPYKIGGSEKDFTSKIKVTATYAAYNANAKKPSSDPYELKWMKSVGNSSGTLASLTGANAPKYDGRYYTTNFASLVGVDPETLKADGTEEDLKEYPPATENYYKGVKDGQTKAVVITYTVVAQDVFDNLKVGNYLSYYDHNDKLPLPQTDKKDVTTGAGIGAKTPQSKKFSLPVTWKK